MQLDPNTIAECILAVLTASGGAWKGTKMVLGASKAKRERYGKEILVLARTETERVKEGLESKISKLNEEVQTLKISVGKDLANLKENHALELKNLGEKIELLRDELKATSSGILALLTKLVDK